MRLTSQLQVSTLIYSVQLITKNLPHFLFADDCRTQFLESVNLSYLQAQRSLDYFNTIINKAKRDDDYLSSSAAHSHNIRSYLSISIGFIDLMRSDDVSLEDINSSLEIIHRKIGLIEKYIIETTDIDATHEDHLFQPIAIHDLARTNTDSFQGLTYNDVALHLHIDESVPHTLRTNYIAFTQVTHNLLSNAIKFTDQGSITVKLAHHKDSEMIECSVIDTGKGFSDPDTILGNSTLGVNNQIGTGYGLKSCCHLLRKINGSLTWRSAPKEASVSGKETSFSFRLPAKLAVS